MSDDELFGDSVYEQGVEDAETMDPAEELLDQDLEEPYDTSYSPPDREPKATRWGTTALEEQYGEPLDLRLAEEEPDIDPDARDDELPDPRAGRLVAPDEGVHLDDEPDEVAFDVGKAGSAASAEEAAVHIVDEAELNEQDTNEDDIGR
jgi:hypothetical protein